MPALTARVRERAHAGAPDCPCGGAPSPAPPAPPLADRPDATVVRHAGIVAKAHAADADPAELALRVTVAARLPGILLPPARPDARRAARSARHVLAVRHPCGPGGPGRGRPGRPRPPLLARLHRTPAPIAVPPHARPREGRASRRPPPDRRPAPPPPPPPCCTPGPPSPPGPGRGGPPCRTRTPSATATSTSASSYATPRPEGPWLLIDVDDLGTGVPAWDLARPAAWYACGLLSPDDWHRFLTAYRAAGGPAVPPHGDPWPALDVPARALTAQTAAWAVAKAAAADRPLDEVERSLVDACARMASIGPRAPRG